MTSLNVTLVNVIRTDKRVALLAIREDSVRQAFTVASQIAERAVQQLHTVGASNRPLVIKVVDGVVVSWDAENEG